MNRNMRIRRFSKKSNLFDILFPQTLTSNVLRRDDGGVLEAYLHMYDKHIVNPIPHLNHAVSTGTYRHLEAHIHNEVLVDGFPLLLKLHTNVECEPTLDFNGNGPKYIVSGSGDRIPGGQCEGSTMFLIWDERRDVWTLISSDNYTDVTKVALPTETEYNYLAMADGETAIVIPGFDFHSDKLEINYGQTILRNGIDYEFHYRQPNIVHLKGFALIKGDLLHFRITKYHVVAKRGTLKYDIVPNDYKVTIKEDHTTKVALPQEAIGSHSIQLNYGQTILRNGIDYEFDEHGFNVLLKFEMMKDDILVFHVEEFIESNGEIVPNNWGATGNYRYNLNILHGEYESTEDNITIIPVPNYNPRRDELTVIQDNHLLVYDVDYTIDTLGQIVLLQSHLDTGECIYFTILQGAMMDVPNFNVIQASGISGQHLLLDMSYEVLCNYYTLLVKLTHDLETAPTAKCIDGPAEAICDCFGNPIYGGYKAGSFLWLVYNEEQHVWYSLGHGQMDITNRYPTYLFAEGDSYFISGKPIDPDYDKNMVGEVIIEHGLGVKPSEIKIRPSEPPNIDEDGNRTTIGDIWSYADETNLYVGNTGSATSKFHWSVSTQERTTDLRTYIENAINELKSRPGNVFTKPFVFTCTESNTYQITIPEFNSKLDKLIVNYGQTILREGIDYDITDNGIELLYMTLDVDDILQFIIIIQEAVEN